MGFCPQGEDFLVLPSEKMLRTACIFIWDAEFVSRWAHRRKSFGVDSALKPEVVRLQREERYEAGEHLVDAMVDMC
jgi:hypothetical protein